jgi:hypothetical protein
MFSLLLIDINKFVYMELELIEIIWHITGYYSLVARDGW